MSLEKKEKAESLLSLILLVQIPFAILYEVFTISKIWDWLILKYIPYQINSSLIIGIGLVLSIYQIKPIKPKDYKFVDDFVNTLGNNYLVPTVALVTAYIVSLINK